MTTKNDEAWKKVFEDLNLLELIDLEGYVLISATTLKECSGREPRLMAKQDTLESRPEIFRRNHLVILPTKNGEYIIFRDSHHRSYYVFDSDAGMIPVETHTSAPHIDTIETINLSSITSEFQAIDYANIVSVLKTYTNEPDLFLTIRGRSRSGSFTIALPDQDIPIQIEGVQIEVDSGYEGSNGIYIIEAKVGRRQDFHIRQLYFPWKEWSSKSEKPVIPIFFTYSNGLFYLSTFRFGDQYGDIEIVDQKCYSVDEDPVLSISYHHLATTIPVDTVEPEIVPFPQANDLDKIIDLIISYSDELNTKDSITDYFEFDERQADYYANAAIYLDFLDRGESRGHFILTPLGQELQRCRTRRCRNALLLSQLFKRPTYRHSIGLLKNSQFIVDSIAIDDIAGLIQRFDPRYNEVTRHRRASTVKSWLKWINANISFTY